MSCLSALHWQIATLLSVPHEVLLLRHRVFREYAKIAVGPDFIHTLPSFMILTAVVLVLWKCPPSFARLAELLGTFLHKGLQVSVSWLAINAILWLWLILQRILYCSVWHYWSYESEYRDVSYPWWQRVWSSYYPARVQPPVMSAGFISWIVAMLIAITVLGCATFTSRVRAFIEDTRTRVRNTVTLAKCYAKRPWDRLQRTIVNSEMNGANGWRQTDDSEISSIGDDSRSEMSVDANSGARGDIHPTSYGTNWIPRPHFSTFKEAHRKISMKSFHTTAGVNDAQDPDNSAAKQSRLRRGCHTVIPSNSSEQSSGC